ncbi:MAG: hypothetical protein WC073_15170 [Sterolibacterium sp.]
MQDDRWRKLYYAIRMFKGTPPRELSPEDARADRQYPGMGFGVVHTFSKTPVPRVIGGWLFSIPCAYFSDARDCQETNANIAHLKVGIGDWAPISPETVDQFLVANSAETIRVTIMGLGQHPASWWQIDPSGLKLLPDPPAGYRKYALAGMNDDHYQLYLPSKPNGYHHQFQCTDPQWAEQKRIMDHCLMRFMYRDSVAVEIKFSAQARDQWPRLREATEKLVGTFQVRR